MQLNLDREKLLRLARRKGIYSVKDLSVACGVHPNSITPYLKGARSPVTQVVTKLANLLEVSPLELIADNEAKELCQLKKLLDPEISSDLALLLFGSRSRGSARKYSDVDLGVTGGARKIGYSEFSGILDRIEMLTEDYPLSVNVVNLDAAPLDFISEVIDDLQFFSGSRSRASYFQGEAHGRTASQKSK